MMTNKQERECRAAFDDWNGKPLTFNQWEFYQGWKACYSWLLENKKEEFDEMLNEMYNDYKQENPKEDL